MPLLPPFIPLVGGLGTSGLALAGLVGLAAAWGWLTLQWRAQPSASPSRPRPTAPAAPHAAAMEGAPLATAARPPISEVRAAVEAAIVPMLLGTLIGGRLLNQIAVPDLQLSAPTSWLAVTGSSMSFTGVLAGLAAAAWWTLRTRPAAVRWAALDTLAPAVALVVAIGWLGLPIVGRQTQWPWGWPAAPGILVQPVQIYGCLAFLAIAAYLAWQGPRSDYLGQNAATLLALAGAVRFVLAFAAQATPTIGPWTLTQLGDAATVAAGLVLAAVLGRTAPARPAAPSARLPAPTNGGETP